MTKLNLLKSIHLIILLPFIVYAQFELPAVIRTTAPDFGYAPGTWGHIQLSRPYGVKGIVLQEWEDLSVTNPLNGEVLNTDRQGWMPHHGAASVWSQIHPNLVAPNDTLVPSLLVNYKQGEGDFKDFTMWYHNSLGQLTRYGLTSKLRSHQRFSDVTRYEEQRHRFQIFHEGEESQVLAEVGYTHQINPLYVSVWDSTALVWDYQYDLEIQADRWDGFYKWNNFDSTSRGSEVFAMLEGGLWSLRGETSNLVNAIGYLGHRFKVGKLSPLEIKLGYISRQLGPNFSRRHFSEIQLPRIKWNGIFADIGLKNIGMKELLPNFQLNYESGVLQVKYNTRHLIEDPNGWPELLITTLHEFQSEIKSSKARFLVKGWQGQRLGESLTGYHAETQLRLPWELDLNLAYSSVNNAVDWVWSSQEISWAMNKDFMLFDQALFGHLKLWGRHLMNPTLGQIDIESLQIVPVINSTSNAPLHLVNYTIQGQISTMIIAFTDANTLQDPLWSNYVQVPWESDFQVMANQFPDSRFRYLSIVWVFDN